MKALEEKILREGTVLPGNILKVGNFLNHRLDTAFLMEMGEKQRLCSKRRRSRLCKSVHSSYG